MKKRGADIIYSPSDLVRYLASPFASWLDRYCLEYPGQIIPDEQSEEEKILSQAGDKHEQSVLNIYKTTAVNVIEIAKDSEQFEPHTRRLWRRSVTGHPLFTKLLCEMKRSKATPIS